MNKKTALLQLFFAVLITLVVLLYGEQIREYASLGYLGVFIISLLSSATIIIPAPGWIVVLELGRVLDPVLLALSAGIGSALGELTGYFAGSGIVGLIEQKGKKLFNGHKEFIRKNNFLAILLLAFIPNPLFDIAGIAAGALKMDVKKFLLACAIGKSIRFFILAYLGMLSVEFL